MPTNQPHKKLLGWVPESFLSARHPPASAPTLEAFCVVGLLASIVHRSCQRYYLNIFRNNLFPKSKQRTKKRLEKVTWWANFSSLVASSQEEQNPRVANLIFVFSKNTMWKYARIQTIRRITNARISAQGFTTQGSRRKDSRRKDLGARVILGGRRQVLRAMATRWNYYSKTSSPGSCSR